MKAVRTIRSLAVLLSVLMLSAYARAEVTLIDKDGFKFSFSGFIEADAIHDTTRGFTEVMGNRGVTPSGTAGGGGDNGQTQFSIRNTRMAFKLNVPEVSDWKTLGYMEYDLLGATNTSEASAFTSPTLRVRHAYFQSEKDGWQITAGQTWELLGWQPYYFLESVDVMPLPGSLYARTPQVRGMKTITINEKSKVEIAAAILRPPQENSSMPDFQAGARFSSTALQSGASGSSTGPRRLMPLSAAVSGAFRQYAIQDAAGTGTTKHGGYALAADTMIPILPSRNGNLSNTISLFGEFTYGEGDGDQFNQWTGGAAKLTTNDANSGITNSLDPGIGYFSGTNFNLLRIMTWNTHLQYQLPNDMPDFVDVGYSQVFSDNALGNTTLANPYNKINMLFANWFHDFTPNLRAGFEYVYDQTTYKLNQAHDSRYQVSGFFFF